MTQTTSPFPSGSLSSSVDRVYVNVLDYTKVSVTSSYANNALTASYILGGGANGSSGTSGGSSWTPELVKQSAAGVQALVDGNDPVRLRLTVKRNGVACDRFRFRKAPETSPR